MTQRSFNDSLWPNWRKDLAKVDSWLPSQRPRYKDTRTGTVYRLDQVTKGQVTLTKECGAQRLFQASTFEKFFKRL